MNFIALNKNMCLKLLKVGLAFSILFSACTIPRKYQKGKPFVAKNTIEVKEGNFSKDERNTLKQRLNGQLDDSSKIKVIDKYFIRHVIMSPPAYDIASAALSTKNMRASMLHLGYYGARATFNADTISKGNQKRVTVNYLIKTGKPTLIDTVIYFLRDSTLQNITTKNLDKTLLKKQQPVTKAAVLGEVSRLVELYRNNGYYKFTAEELKVRGDTSIAALTTISDDPFEQLQLLAEAQAKRDSPTIKMAIVLNAPNDKAKVKQYYINNIYILPDYEIGDSLNDPTLTERVTQNCIIRYHSKLFRSNFLTQNMFLKKGDLYRQDDYYKSLNSFTKMGVWQNTNILIKEIKDSNKIDLVVQLIPTYKYTFEASLEASYSANSNSNNVTTVNAGNLLGLSGNASITNRNVNKEAIKMTNAFRAGVELNLGANKKVGGSIVNSNELSYNLNLVLPKFVKPVRSIFKKLKLTTDNQETFLNVSPSYINRINLFNLQSINLATGIGGTNKKQDKWVLKLLNIEYAKLYNETDSFIKTLQENPFLRYSFNTSLVAGMSFNYSSIRINKRNTNKQHSFNVNVEESGFITVIPLRKLGGIFSEEKNLLRQFIKADVEYIHSITYPKSNLVFRLFGGVGFSSKKDTTLPFFKQYFAGGANSMRGWPIRGIGRGIQPLTPYSENKFNDRTGDIRLEGNVEYRFALAQIIPNALILKGVLFADAGNIWNLRNSKPGGNDSASFQIKNIYRDLGVAAGTGLRLDFNYVVLRFDLGFRFKRPELAYENNGWKAPSIGFNDAFGKLFKKEFKEWRYNNMNFTIGISYPF
jgi:outer membrane protein insertion porin family